MRGPGVNQMCQPCWGPFPFCQQTEDWPKVAVSLWQSWDQGPDLSAPPHCCRTSPLPRRHQSTILSLQSPVLTVDNKLGLLRPRSLQASKPQDHCWYPAAGLPLGLRGCTLIPQPLRMPTALAQLRQWDVFPPTRYLSESRCPAHLPGLGSTHCSL